MKKFPSKFIFVFLTAAFFSPAFSHADAIRLKTNEVREGKVLAESDEWVEFETSGQVVRYAKADIITLNRSSDSVWDRSDLEGARASSREIFTKQMTVNELKGKILSLRDHFLRNYSNELRDDEKDILQSAGDVMKMGLDEFYRSETNEKILNLMVRYLEQFVAREETSAERDPAAKFFGEGYTKEIKQKIQSALLPHVKSLKEYVSSYLKNLNELRYAIEQAEKA